MNAEFAVWQCLLEAFHARLGGRLAQSEEEFLKARQPLEVLVSADSLPPGVGREVKSSSRRGTRGHGVPTFTESALTAFH
jgi:hypothetical protein